jgi:hypothetical protein
MERVSAKIEDAKALKISKIWRKKPPGVAFSDTDAVIVVAKTPDGTEIRDTFYLRLKADGTFSTAAVGRISRSKQERFAKFLKRYITKEEVKGYNVKERVGEWKGKSVEVVPYKRTGFIYV